MTSTSQTLADRMASGRIPVGDAMKVALQLADQLRQLHDQGVSHGDLTPGTIACVGTAILILPPTGVVVKPYTAPEVVDGQPADARSDIYSFGAIFYELMTGRPVDASSPEPCSTGSPAVDRMVNACMAKSPDARFQRMQRVMLDLKLLPAAARWETIAPSVPAPPVPAATLPGFAPAAAGYGQMQDLEGRIGARMAEQERAIASMTQVANELLMTLRQQQAAAAPPPSQAPHYYAPAPPPPPHRPYGAYAAEPYPDYRLDKGVDASGDRLARLDLLVGTAVERLARLEQQLEAWDSDAAELRDSVTRDIRNFERALKSQSTVIESTRTAMGQTDDLVERVVEALDSLQSMFVSGADEQSLAS